MRNAAVSRGGCWMGSSKPTWKYQEATVMMLGRRVIRKRKRRCPVAVNASFLDFLALVRTSTGLCVACYPLPVALSLPISKNQQLLTKRRGALNEDCWRWSREIFIGEGLRLLLCLCWLVCFLAFQMLMLPFMSTEWKLLVQDQTHSSSMEAVKASMLPSSMNPLALLKPNNLSRESPASGTSKKFS